MKLKKAIKKWHRKALMIDPKKTTLLLLESGDAKPKHVPPWVQKREVSPAVREFFSLAWHEAESLDSSVCADTDTNELSEPQHGSMFPAQKELP
jgi:hypothetical protein